MGEGGGDQHKEAGKIGKDSKAIHDCLVTKVITANEVRLVCGDIEGGRGFI